MAKVVREEVSKLSSKISLTIERADYEPKFKTELTKYQQKSHMKGFRKGKTPMGLIKKMYGKALLADVINEVLQKKLSDYLIEEKLDILGQPLPADDQAELDFDVNNLTDFEFKFDIGIAPEFELKGLSTESKFSKYAVDVDPAMVDKDMNNIREKVGKRIEIETQIEEKDVLKINAEELEGDKAKKNGWATTFEIAVDLIADEDLKADVLAKQKGDKIRFNVNTLEKDRDEAYIRKYILNVSENDTEVEIGEHFEGTIELVYRMGPADLDQELFDKAFGEGKVSSEEEARGMIEKEIEAYYDKQAEALLYRDFQNALTEENELELPDEFLKKWLKASNEEVSAEVIEKEYDPFANNLKWSLVKGKIVKQFDLNLTEEEIFEGLKNRVRSYFGGYGDELIVLNMANRLMDDEKQVNQMQEELMSDKMFKAMRDQVTIEEKKIASSEFDEILKEAKAKIEAANAQAAAESTPETATEEIVENIEEA